MLFHSAATRRTQTTKRKRQISEIGGLNLIYAFQFRFNVNLKSPVDVMTSNYKSMYLLFFLLLWVFKLVPTDVWNYAERTVSCLIPNISREVNSRGRDNVVHEINLSICVRRLCVHVWTRACSLYILTVDINVRLFDDVTISFSTNL